MAWPWEAVLQWVRVWDTFWSLFLRDGMVIPFLIFPGSSVLFSIAPAPVSIATNSAPGSPFPRPCQRLFFLVLCFLVMAFLTVWGDISSWFCLHLPADLWCRVPFHVPVGHLYVTFGKVSVQDFACFLIGLFVFSFGCSCMNFYIVWILPLIKCMIC